MQQNRSSIIQPLLWAVVIFLGYQIFVGMPNSGPKKSVVELQKELTENNLKILDQTISLKTYPAYTSAVDSDKNLKQDEKDRLKLQGLVLVADTQYKAAMQRQDINRVITANDALQGWQRQLEKKPVWNEPVKVAWHKDFPVSEITPAQLKEKVRDLSSKLGRETPVWGFFPGFQLIDLMVRMTGAVPAFSYALACFLLAFTVRAVVFPLTQKQIMFGRQMSQLSPLVTEIKEKYKRKDGKQLDMKDQQEMNQEMMGLYQQYGINPASGCWPVMLQMPLFFMIYQSMLHYRFEFEKGLFLWISPGPSASSDGFIAANLGQKDYILLVLYAISMVVSTFLSPISDPANARQQRIMGVSISLVFGVMMFFWPVPSAFVLYWTFTNILATAQSLYSYRLPLEPLQKKVTAAGGIIPPPNGKMASPTVKTGVPQRHKPKRKK
jgi:YidC/Oxa1 family membrane protein insertase